MKEPGPPHLYRVETMVGLPRGALYPKVMTSIRLCEVSISHHLKMIRIFGKGWNASEVSQHKQSVRLLIQHRRKMKQLLKPVN